MKQKHDGRVRCSAWLGGIDVPRLCIWLNKQEHPTQHLDIVHGNGLWVLAIRAKQLAKTLHQRLTTRRPEKPQSLCAVIVNRARGKSPLYQQVCHALYRLFGWLFHARDVLQPNDPSSATRPKRGAE